MPIQSTISGSDSVQPTAGAGRNAWLHLVRGDAGATLVELGLTLPIFFLLIFGVFNFALVLFGFCNVTYASRYAARVASVHSNTSMVPTTAASIQSLVAPFIFAYPKNTTSTTFLYNQEYAASGGNLVGNAIQVTVSITYTLSMPLFTYNGPTLSSTTYAIIIQ